MQSSSQYSYPRRPWWKFIQPLSNVSPIYPFWKWLRCQLYPAQPRDWILVQFKNEVRSYYVHFIELTHVDTQNTIHRAVSLCCCRGTHKSSCYYMKIALLVSKPWHEEPGSCHHQVTSPQPLVWRVICLLGSLQECILKFKTLPKTHSEIYKTQEQHPKKSVIFKSCLSGMFSAIWSHNRTKLFTIQNKTPKYYTCNHTY